VNHVRFTGRVGRRELPYGTYRVTARTPGRAPSRPVLVAVGELRVTNGFSCSSAPADPFEEILGTFGSAPGSTAASQTTGSSTATKGQKTEKKREGGVLPAVSERLSDLPEALPELSVPAASDSPSAILGIGALLLLVVSAAALVFYFVRSLRRPNTT
jgi:hypothetical protein